MLIRFLICLLSLYYKSCNSATICTCSKWHIVRNEPLTKSILPLYPVKHPREFWESTFKMTTCLRSCDWWRLQIYHEALALFSLCRQQLCMSTQCVSLIMNWYTVDIWEQTYLKRFSNVYTHMRLFTRSPTKLRDYNSISNKSAN